MVDTAVARIIHLIFAAIWAGSVCYVAFVVLPLARDGAFTTTEPLTALSGKLTTISRVSALVLLLTGGHLAGRGYSIGGGTRPDLFTSTNGQLVLLMVVLWLVLAALVEIGGKRFESGLEAKKLREPARNVLTVYRAAAVVAIGLLVVSGAITTNLVGQFL